MTEQGVIVSLKLPLAFVPAASLPGHPLKFRAVLACLDPRGHNLCSLSKTDLTPSRTSEEEPALS